MAFKAGLTFSGKACDVLQGTCIFNFNVFAKDKPPAGAEIGLG